MRRVDPASGSADGDAGAPLPRSTIDADSQRAPDIADEALAARLMGGDAAALADLYDRHAGAAMATAMRVVGGREEAEDVVHDAFLTVWRKIALFDDSRGSLRSWLMTIVRNRSIDRVRARRPRMDVDVADEMALLRTGPNPTWEQALQRTTATEVRSALATLNDDQRRAVELAYFEGYTYREVAAVTGVPIGTASGRLRLALEKLRTALGDPGPRIGEER